MNIELQHNEKFIILKLHGDSFSEEDLSDLVKLVEEKTQKGKNHYALSFSQNAYPNSKVISALVRCLRVIQQFNGTLTIIHPSKELERILEITNLKELISII